MTNAVIIDCVPNVDVALGIDLAALADLLIDAVATFG